MGWKLLLVPVAAYLLIVGLVWFAQERLLFPAYLVAPAGPMPPGAERLSFDAPDGVRLEGLRIPSSHPGDGTLLLAFAGNATNAQGFVELLHDIHPAADIVAFFYRGYPPSGGAPDAARLMDDAPLVYDRVVERLRPRRVVAVGVSLGSGVAAALAPRRPLAGLILVTPFDSLMAAARQLYPWLPVRLLLRHDMPSAELLRGVRAPVAIIAAGDDRLIRPERTAALRRAVQRPVFDRVVQDAGHNDIFHHPEFAPAMRAALRAITEP